MRKSRFTEQQIVAIVRESEREGLTVGQVAKQHGITETTLFRWRKRFSGLDASQAAELRRLQHGGCAEGWAGGVRAGGRAA
jgi:putative transposase